MKSTIEFPEPDSKRRYVIQSHIRGRSEHADIRREMNGYLVGEEIVGGNVDKPIFDEFIKSEGKQFRIEFKACQPKSWLVVTELDEYGKTPLTEEEIDKLWEKIRIGSSITVPKGAIGATKHKEGKFIVVDYGTYWEGAQKPYFKEFFYNGKKLKNWTRVVYIAVRVPVLRNKIPTEQKEIMWTIMIPKDQTPYCLTKRAREKGYYPPKGVIPVPPNWRDTPEFKEWYEWVQKKWEENPEGSIGIEEEEIELAEKEVTFTLHEVRWLGHIIRRGVPVRRYYLRIDDKGKGKIMSWELDDNPLFATPVFAVYEGRVARKWLDYTGLLEPDSEYNPNKELQATMLILASGKAGYRQLTTKDKRKVIILDVKSGDMKGKWALIQHEKGSDRWVFNYIEELEGSASGRFVLHKVTLQSIGDIEVSEKPVHFTLRIDKGTDEIEKYVLSDDITKRQVVDAYFDVCYDKRWFDKEREEDEVGEYKILVELVDKGEAYKIEDNEFFKSYYLVGEKLFGYYYAKKDLEEDKWEFGVMNFPPTKLHAGNPLTGDYYEPFVYEKKKTWSYFILYVYDPRFFTRAEPLEKVKEYLPDIEIPEGVKIVIGLYRVPDEIHHARVMYVVFPDTWTVNDAVEFIKKNKLHTWESKQIRG